MNGYARVSHLKADIAGLTSGDTSKDETLARAVAEVSREFDQEAGRHFYSYTGVRYYAGHRRSPAVLRLPHDLVSVTSLLVDDDTNGTYEMTLVADTDYWLSPQAAAQLGEPYWNLELNPNGTQLYRWPTSPRAIKLTGIFGYSNEVESTGLTVLDDGGSISISETGITLSSSASVGVIDIGDTIVIESEQLDVTAVSMSTITATRAVNGTTAATHADGVTVYRRRYPRDIEEAVKERVVGLRWDAQGGYAGQATLTGDAFGASGSTTLRASYARWRRTVNRYSALVVS